MWMRSWSDPDTDWEAEIGREMISCERITESLSPGKYRSLCERRRAKRSITEIGWGGTRGVAKAEDGWSGLPGEDSNVENLGVIDSL